MKNIPVFMSSGGTATLVLQEIPVSGRAFVILQSILPDSLSSLLEECRAFCVSCGAKEIFVSDTLNTLPLRHAYNILWLAVEKSALPEYKPVALEPLSEDNGDTYISIYNQCFQGISHAVSYNKAQLKRIAQQHQQAYIAYNQEHIPIGIGELHDNELAAIAVLPEFHGAGKNLAGTLLAKCPGPELFLTVASDNERALHLYEKLDFHVKKIESRWYRL